jgi:hypothetical protein
VRLDLIRQVFEERAEREQETEQLWHARERSTEVRHQGRER